MIEISKENLAKCVEKLLFLWGDATNLAERIRQDEFVKVSALYHGNKNFTDIEFSQEPLTVIPQPKVWCGWGIAYIVSNLPYISEYPVADHFAKNLDFPNSIRLD